MRMVSLPLTIEILSRLRGARPHLRKSYVHRFKGLRQWRSYLSGLAAGRWQSDCELPRLHDSPLAESGCQQTSRRKLSPQLCRIRRWPETRSERAVENAVAAFHVVGLSRRP